MILGTDPAALSLAADAQGVDSLRLQAKNNPQAAVKEAARQFEALLLNVMMKGMRQTAGQDGMFDNEQTRLYTSMLDQQLAESMSRRGIGLAQVLERQLSPAPKAQVQTPANASAAQPAAAPAAKLASPGLPSTPALPIPAPAKTPSLKPHVRAFVERLLPEAQAASSETGIPARFLLGHAALETGWGRSEIRGADGTPSHNLFGIKAGGDWQGSTVKTLTTEYVDGMARRKIDTYRAYGSYQEAFRDYASLLNSRSRYAEVLKNTHDAHAYARELQEAGYATDPHYADKLASVIDGESLRRSMTT